VAGPPPGDDLGVAALFYPREGERKMINDRFYQISVGGITVVLAFLVYAILKPFFSPLAWAIVLAILFYPLYAFAVKRVRNSSLCALMVVAIILLTIVGPFSYLAFSLSRELTALQGDVMAGKLEGIRTVLHHPMIRNTTERISSLTGIAPLELDRIIADNMAQVVKELAGTVTRGVREILSVMLNFVIMMLSIFFFLKHGSSIAQRAYDYAPFSDNQKSRLAKQGKDIVVSTIYGGVIVGLAQGFLGGVAFSLVDISAPVFWGAVMAVFSFLPLIGPFVIWAPAATFLFLDGAVGRGIALVIMGALGISMVDNILRPLIIKNRTKMPFLAVFISVLGGIKYFGLIGFVLGPLVLAVFVSVIDIFIHSDRME
jgi:predicted PurR-regulated permease PerM